MWGRLSSEPPYTMFKESAFQRLEPREPASPSDVGTRDPRILSPSSSEPIDASATCESESGCSEVPDVVEISEVIDEVSQADSSSVDHGE